MNHAIIQTEGLRFAYAEEGAVNPFVLDGVSLDIEEGSFVAVLGHNGSGKSTLAKHLNAILLPSGGKVYVDGIDTADEDKLLDIRRTVGMVFQNPDNQIVANVVEEDVAFAPENLGVPPAEIRRRVDDALKAVGMYEYREHAPHLLSGGQKQRLTIARALVKNPEILILDDSASALDFATDARLRQAIGNLKDRMTVFIVSQRASSVMYADLILVMEDGRLAGAGSHGELLETCSVYREIYESQFESRQEEA